MKLTSWLALGALIGRELAPGSRNWKDAILAAVLAKNELIDRDGCLRQLAGGQESDQEAREEETPDSGRRGFLYGFHKGLKGET